MESHECTNRDFKSVGGSICAAKILQSARILKIFSSLWSGKIFAALWHIDCKNTSKKKNRTLSHSNISSFYTVFLSFMIGSKWQLFRSQSIVSLIFFWNPFQKISKGKKTWTLRPWILLRFWNLNSYTHEIPYKLNESLIYYSWSRLQQVKILCGALLWEFALIGG